jgi:cardiolipin synthase
LQAAGGEVRWFNPVSILRWSFRNHCKLVLADDYGVVGGMNLADEQLGDGVAMGWRDLALELRGPTVATMREEFDRMWSLAAFDVRSIRTYWRGAAPASSGGPVQALMTGPGHSGTGLVRRAYADLREARSVSAHAPYFLPSRRLRGLLRQVARRGRVRILVGATSDVPLARLATLRAMRKMDGSDVEFFDYRPQVLHSKLLVIDDIVYVGSANLDARSRLINFELMLRVESSYVAAQARDLFDEDLRHAVSSVRAPPTAWQRLREEAAHWLLARLDPYLALRALRSMR